MKLMNDKRRSDDHRMARHDSIDREHRAFCHDLGSDASGNHRVWLRCTIGAGARTS